MLWFLKGRGDTATDMDVQSATAGGQTARGRSTVHQIYAPDETENLMRTIGKYSALNV